MRHGLGGIHLAFTTFSLQAETPYWWRMAAEKNRRQGSREVGGVGLGEKGVGAAGVGAIFIVCVHLNL